jgi:hypothetical protein
LWVCRFDDDNLLPTLILGSDRLLRRRRKTAACLRAGSHALHRAHDIRLLCKECIPEVSGPANVLVQFLQGVRYGHERLNARIPGLLLGGIKECLALEIPVPLQPLTCLHYFERVRAGHKYLSQKRIGVERNRSHEVVELICRPQLLRRRLCLRLLLQRRGGRPLFLCPYHRRSTQDCKSQKS